MAESQLFSYQVVNSALGIDSLMPYVEIRLANTATTILTHALLDTGAAINVLPFTLGNQLGLVWEAQSTAIKLTGNLAAFDAKGIILTLSIGDLPAKRQAFAWTKSDDVPVLLGQVNFFNEFDVCFFKNRQQIQVSVKTNTG